MVRSSRILILISLVLFILPVYSDFFPLTIETYPDSEFLTHLSGEERSLFKKSALEVLINEKKKTLLFSRESSFSENEILSHIKNIDTQINLFSDHEKKDSSVLTPDGKSVSEKEEKIFPFFLPSQKIYNDERLTYVIANQYMIETEDNFTALSLEKILDPLNGKILWDYKLSNLYLVKIDQPDKIELLLKNPGIKTFIPNLFIDKNKAEFISDPIYSTFSDIFKWHIDHLKLNKIFPMTTGNSTVNLAVIDTPADLLHRELTHNLLYTQNITGQIQAQQHGTHILGIIHAGLNNNFGTTGIAPDCNIIYIGALSRYGSSVSTIVRAIQIALKQGSHVINLSCGPDLSKISQMTASRINKNKAQDALILINKELKSIYKPIFDLVQKQNSLLVISAGNDALDMENFDYFSHPAVISVGAVGTENILTDFTCFGKNVDIYAPGDTIYSCFPDNQFGFLSGTSMAAPFVTGIAGLMKSLSYNLSSSTLKKILIESAIVKKSSELKFDYRCLDPVNAIGQIIEFQKKDKENTTSSFNPLLASRELQKLSEIQQLESEKNYQEALIQINKLINTSKDPDIQKKAMYKKAVLLAKLNQYKESIEYSQKLITLFPQVQLFKSLYLLLAKSYFFNENYKSSLYWALKSLELSEFSNTSEILFLIARLYGDYLNNPDQAITYYQSLIEKYPGSDEGIRSLLLISKIYVEKKEPGVAIQFLRKAIDEYPEHAIKPFCILELSKLLSSDTYREYIRAYKILEELLEDQSFPEIKEAMVIGLTIAIKLNRISDAKRLIERLKEINYDVTSLQKMLNNTLGNKN